MSLGLLGRLGITDPAAFAALSETKQHETLEASIREMPFPQQVALRHEFDPPFRQAAAQGIEAYLRYLDLGFVPAAHHRLLIALLEDVERGDCERAMICMPPGSAKSTYASVLFTAWYLGRNPMRSVIGVSHTLDLIERFSRRARNLVDSDLHRAVFGCGVADGSSAVGNWETEYGGEYFAVGIGGAIGGRRADLGLIDDPVRSREDADSERQRNRVWDWYINDFLTRLKPGASQVLIMTRWHEDDLAGRILLHEGERWRVLKLPMEAQGDDPLGRLPGERLWPEWFTAEMAADAKRDVRAWHALYQQEPASEDGDYFKREWFQESERPPAKLAVYGASDYAVTERGGDFTEHGIFGLDSWGNLHILDWWRGQTSPDIWIEEKCRLIRKHKPLCWFGESGPIRRAIEPFLLRRLDERNAYCRIEWLPSVSDKAARCRPFQALAASGKVFFPLVAGWKTDLIGQLLRFPAGRYDDGVDVCSLIGRGLEFVRPPESDNERLPQVNLGYAHAKRRFDSHRPY